MRTLIIEYTDNKYKKIEGIELSSMSTINIDKENTEEYEVWITVYKNMGKLFRAGGKIKSMLLIEEDRSVITLSNIRRWLTDGSEPELKMLCNGRKIQCHDPMIPQLDETTKWVKRNSDLDYEDCRFSMLTLDVPGTPTKTLLAEKDFAYFENSHRDGAYREICIYLKKITQFEILEIDRKGGISKVTLIDNEGYKDCRIDGIKMYHNLSKVVLRGICKPIRKEEK